MSDVLIWLSYVAIPFALLFFARRKRDVPFRALFVLFGLFIVSCGFSHLTDAVTFFVPMYRLSALVKVVTAIASIATVIALFPILPQALALRSPQELEREIQERRRAEAALAERARALDEANHKLRESERLKDEFFANVSHELRTPLTLILAPVEAMLTGADSLTDSQGQQLQTVHNNAVRLLQLINGLLDFSKLEAGQVSPHRQPTRIMPLTQSLLADFQPLLQKKNLHLDLQASVEPVCVSIDRYLYERILYNLLSNAVKFTPAGGRITVRLQHAGDQLTLEVQDSGIGITSEQLPELFKKFRQLEGSATRRFEGTGLGLAMVKEFAELLGGTAAVTSEREKGSTFTVRCQAPACTLDDTNGASAERSSMMMPRFTPATIPATTDGNDADKPRVLVVEDNAELAANICELLRDTCRTRTAENGEQGLQAVQDWQPDLVLTDVMMPLRDGLSLCRELKASPATRAIPVILLTAVTHREALLRGWEAGADEYLYKPFHPTELITRVNTLLKSSLARRAAERQLRDANELLERRVAERTADLEARARELTELNGVLTRVNEELDDFAHIAAHDLKEPLRGIGYYSQILLEDFREQIDGEGRLKLETLRALSDRMAKLIDSLHQYSRLGRTGMTPGECSLDRIVDEVLDSLRINLAENGVTVLVHRPLPDAVCDALGVRGIFHNLITNAIKYNDKADKRIEIGHLPGNPTVFYVRDNGIGIREKHRAAVFRIFKRLHGRDEYGGGTGAGLTIAKKIVERHDGRIWLESTFGEGSTFYFTLASEVSNDQPGLTAHSVS